MTRRAALACALALCAACAGRSGRERTAPPTAAPGPTEPAPSSAPAGSAVAAQPVPPAPDHANAPDAAPSPLVFTREREEPVHFIALDRAPHVSALSERAALIHDAKGWRAEPLPPAATGEGSLSLFYGRDFRVRLVGTRHVDGSPNSVYFRWLPGGFRAAPDELGRLGAVRAGGLVAVLGTEDPEVVCRPGDVCLVKRLSGWATISAPAELELLAIHGGAAWAVAGRTLLRVEDDKRWSTLSSDGPWSKANGLFAGWGAVWVLEGGVDRLHRFDGSRWHTVSSPVRNPRALWGAKADALWLGGDGGLAHYDGSLWRHVTSVNGAVHAVAGRATDDVWIGGEQGLFHGMAP